MKKGFTLIELLAVIVILAIIALIATPIVLSIINDIKESASLRSAEMYLRGVEQSIMRENMNANGSFRPNYCEITEKGNLLCDETTEVIVEVDGEKPKGGNISFEEGKIKDIRLAINDKLIEKNEEGKITYTTKVCSLTDSNNNNKADTGEVITCAKEDFYVINDNGTTLSMLAKHNLDAGYEGVQDADSGVTQDILINGTGLQSEKAIGPSAGFDYYGLVAFAPKGSYWCSLGGWFLDIDFANYGRKQPFIYKSSIKNGQEWNGLYTYVDAYEKYLINEGVKSAKGTLISIEDFEKYLGCTIDTSTLNITCDKTLYPWAYSIPYHTGSGYYNPESGWVDCMAVWIVDNGIYSTEAGSVQYGAGIRPLINISSYEI